MEEKNYNKEVSETLSLELYYENGKFCIWLDDNNGGSGIKVTGSTPEEVSANIAKYIADYFYNE